MKESWTDFEKYVFTKLEANQDEHTKITTSLAVLKERIGPKYKSKFALKFTGIAAIITSVVTACKSAV